jgi:hypothetical protein
MRDRRPDRRRTRRLSARAAVGAGRPGAAAPRRSTALSPTRFAQVGQCDLRSGIDLAPRRWPSNTTSASKERVADAEDAIAAVFEVVEERVVRDGSRTTPAAEISSDSPCTSSQLSPPGSIPVNTVAVRMTTPQACRRSCTK